MSRRRKKHYNYSNYRNQRVGRMICCKCNKPITEGDYRYHETEDAYVPEHRACCTQDPTWAKRDEADRKQLEWHEAYRQACREFVAKWGVPDEEDFLDLD